MIYPCSKAAHSTWLSPATRTNPNQINYVSSPYFIPDAIIRQSKYV